MTQAATSAATNGTESAAASARRMCRWDARSFGAVVTRPAGANPGNTAAGVSEAEWRLAQEVARQNGGTPLKALLDLGLMSEQSLAERLSAWSGRPLWRAEEETGTISRALPTEFMRNNGVLLIEQGSGEGASGGAAGGAALRLVVCDPSDHFAWSAVLARFVPPGASADGGAIDIRIGTLKEVRQFLDERAGEAEVEGEAQRRAGAGEEAIDVSSEISALRELASEAPIIRFFNQTVERAMDLGASDIHLERYDRRVSLRYRVDGILVDQPAPTPKMYEPLLCRIKIMSNLDIAERRRAQDGRIRMRLRGRNLDMRVSILPTTYGQDAVLRLQDRQKLAGIELDGLGFSRRQIEFLLRISGKAHGILLITGPTGSGKTTTLYALLRTMVSNERKIITVEDPVEYAMDGVTQIQVNPAINLSFSNTLRNILRHDPDVILIGEIRDRETAEIAFQASLTGHLVLSTLHTNDVPGTFVRLIDMGIEPYLVNAAVEGVTAQRLLRKVCSACRAGGEAKESCRVCGGIGYRGRVALMEFAALGGEVKQLLMERADEMRIRDSLLRGGYRPLRDEARRLVEEGVTDEAEVARVLGHAGVADVAELPDREPVHGAGRSGA